MGIEIVIIKDGDGKEKNHYYYVYSNRIQDSIFSVCFNGVLKCEL